MILNFHDRNSRRLENGHDNYLALKYLSKKKITFTKIAFEKFMKVLLTFCRPDIIQQGNAVGKLYLYFLVMI